MTERSDPIPLWDEFHEKYIAPFDSIDWIFDPDRGYIVWRMGTGNNYEWLHFRVFPAGSEGTVAGESLLREMLTRMKENPPFFSVFAFVRTNNERALAFHKFMGWNVQRVDGVYKDGEAVLIWQEFRKLLQFHGIE